MIVCKAINEGSLYVTASGDVLPCGFIYRNGPLRLDPALKEIIKDENFESLVAGWQNGNPHPLCVITCDDQSQHPMSIKRFKKQWEIKKV
jgi:MoaA/NifB/PqqE/SkfB family radical SAM enzyme